MILLLEHWKYQENHVKMEGLLCALSLSSLPLSLPQAFLIEKRERKEKEGERERERE